MMHLTLALVASVFAGEAAAGYNARSSYEMHAARLRSKPRGHAWRKRQQGGASAAATPVMAVRLLQSDFVVCPQIAQGGSLAFSNLNAIADTEQDYGYVFCTYSQGDGTATNGLACVYNVDGSWDETANVVQADYCQGTTTSDPAPDQSDWMTWTGCPSMDQTGRALNQSNAARTFVYQGPDSQSLNCQYAQDMQGSCSFDLGSGAPSTDNINSCPTTSFNMTASNQWLPPFSGGNATIIASGNSTSTNSTSGI